MKYAAMAFFTCIVSILLWVYQTDDQVTSESMTRLKNALDIATHDASLEVDQEQLDQGNIRFNTSAYSRFLSSLETNLGLDANLNPKADNLFRSTDQLKVLLFEKLETGCPDGSSFPCVYQDSTYNYIDTIYGPSIIAIVSIRSPRPFATSQDLNLIVGSSHEYKPD